MPVKPSEREEEYMARLEYERRKRIEEEKNQKLAVEEKDNLKELHYMKCPKCGLSLVEIGYKGIRVDRCSSCEGLWLDAGELAQIIDLEKSSLDKLFSVFRK